jgi:hypothetical protein
VGCAIPLIFIANCAEFIQPSIDGTGLSRHQHVLSVEHGVEHEIGGGADHDANPLALQAGDRIDAAVPPRHQAMVFSVRNMVATTTTGTAFSAASMIA